MFSRFLYPCCSDRPGPPLSATTHVHEHKSLSHRYWKFMMTITNGGYAYISYGWSTLYATFKEARQMKDVAIFLVAWFMISDAATTINSAAVLLQRRNYRCLRHLWLLLALWLSFRYHGCNIHAKVHCTPTWFNKPSTRHHVCCNSCVIHSHLWYSWIFTEHLGLRHPWEMYVLAAWYGFALGGLNTLCRSVFPC